jgi:hypothetical protein
MYCVDGKRRQLLQCLVREGSRFLLQCMYRVGTEAMRIKQRTEKRSSISFPFRGWLVWVDLPSGCCVHSMTLVHNNIPTDILPSPAAVN